MSEPSHRGADAPQEADVEAITSKLSERFGPDFVALVTQMGLSRKDHFLQLLNARQDEQDHLAMAWMRAAATLEANWSGQSRRQGREDMTLARYLEIRLPSPRDALAAELAPPPVAAAAPAPAPAAPPTPRERESAQRRIRLETAIEDARAAVRRVDGIERLVDADRQAIIGQMEELISIISRRIG